MTIESRSRDLWQNCAGWAVPRRLTAFVVALLLAATSGCMTWFPPTSPYKWKKFVRTAGHANEIPAQWVETEIGRYAHDIQIPNPVPADSGYREGMTAREYWEHLCAKEAGSFIFKTVKDVDGLLFMRPLRMPSDEEIRDRYLFEAGSIQSSAQVREDLERNRDLSYPPVQRAKSFVDPPRTKYKFIEFPHPSGLAYWHMSGHVQDKVEMKIETLMQPESRYGLIWRGIHRPMDRELAISGSEWIVLDVSTKTVLAVLRDFSLSGGVRNSPTGIYWLNGSLCPFRNMFNQDGSTTRALDMEDKVWTKRVLQPSA